MGHQFWSQLPIVKTLNPTVQKTAASVLDYDALPKHERIILLQWSTDVSLHSACPKDLVSIPTSSSYNVIFVKLLLSFISIETSQNNSKES